jgi:hypothetical protein
MKKSGSVMCVWIEHIVRSWFACVGRNQVLLCLFVPLEDEDGFCDACLGH